VKREQSSLGITPYELSKLFPVILTEHNPEWKVNYIKEKELIESIIGKENIARISHFGSTSVPGLTVLTFHRKQLSGQR
jgi:GrpB-like predicted nucleotidyltransferase (UPF0157 family)